VPFPSTFKTAIEKTIPGMFGFVPRTWGGIGIVRPIISAIGKDGEQRRFGMGLGWSEVPGRDQAARVRGRPRQRHRNGASRASAAARSLTNHAA
jgi:hypothetical protein